MQTYPSTSGCNKNANGHIWVPYWAVEPDETFKEENKELFRFKKEYLWKCENRLDGKKCSAQATSLWMPSGKGCEIGIIDKEWRWHTWQRTNQKWRCQKCNAVKKQNGKPSAKGNCKWPFPNYHRWLLQEQEWKCNNCGDVKWMKWISVPPLLGCPRGVIKEKRHSWYTAAKQYKFRIKCSECKSELWHF